MNFALVEEGKLDDIVQHIQRFGASFSQSCKFGDASLMDKGGFF
jgi:hypothetical protein